MLSRPRDPRPPPPPLPDGSLTQIKVTKAVDGCTHKAADGDAISVHYGTSRSLLSWLLSASGVVVARAYPRGHCRATLGHLPCLEYCSIQFGWGHVRAAGWCLSRLLALPRPTDPLFFCFFFSLAAVWAPLFVETAALLPSPAPLPCSSLSAPRRPPPRGSLLWRCTAGKLEDGTPFDSSYDRGSPFDLTLGAGMVIPGTFFARTAGGGLASLTLAGAASTA